MAEGKTYRPLVDILAAGRELPEGYDTWGWKVVRPDLRTRDGFRWPWPGNIATVDDPEPREAGPCGAGLHIALAPCAMQSVRYGCSTVLLLAYNAAEIIAADEVKCRVPRAFVVDVRDLQAILRRDAAGADLKGADLTRANLADAYLTGAYLAGAYLTGAYLTGANLAGADLTGADLTGAYLYRSQLTATQTASITGTPAWVGD